MDRRAFLKTGFAVGAASLPWPVRAAGRWRTYEVDQGRARVSQGCLARVAAAADEGGYRNGIAVSATNGPGRRARRW